jgi:RNA polymerase sigma-B factor
MSAIPITRSRPSRPREVDGRLVERLVTRWRIDHDRRARAELVERFLPLSRRIASRYRNPFEPQEDLEQVAALGLIAAIDRFDPARGPFESFAIPTILGELKRHFRNTGWSVHVTRGAQELAQRVERASREISASMGRAAQVDEIARLLQIETADVLIGLEAGAARYSASLDSPGTAGGEEADPQTLGDTIGDVDGGYGLVETRLSVEAALRRLPHAERTALRLRMERGLKQVEIARELGCSQMQISRLLRSAAGHLRELTDPSLEPAKAGGV